VILLSNKRTVQGGQAGLGSTSLSLPLVRGKGMRPITKAALCPRSIHALIQTPAPLLLGSRFASNARSQSVEARRPQRPDESTERGAWNQRAAEDTRYRGDRNERTVALCGR
jgi:hypothetical protein